jgi:mono/diheme cytochrome c family protein
VPGLERMKKLTLIALCALMLALGLRVYAADQQQTQRKPASPQTPAMAVGHTAAPVAEAQTALVKQYCISCHNDRGKERAGNLTLANFDASQVGQNPQVAETAEKMIRKLRLGMMPPVGMRRPDAATIDAFAASMESRLDQAATLKPNPGHRPFQRLNRSEYQHAVADLLSLDVDVTPFLPADTISAGFDNVADVQSFSATLMEGYLRAASRISSLAVGDPRAGATEATFKVPRTASQMQHVEGAPFGTRGGVSVMHTFPADGEYVFRMQLHSIPTGQLFGSTVKGEQLEVSIDGDRVVVLEINQRMSEADKSGMNIVSPRIHVKAGTQRVSAAFIQRFDAPVDDLMAPIDHTLADTQIGAGFGITTLPHLREFAIGGPFKVTGVSDTPSRKRIFSCRPTSAAEEKPCATEIVRRLATQAYRGPLAVADVEPLMKFYEQGRTDGDFESGVRMALQAILASPRFLFRLEQTPTTVRPGQNYRLADVDLASRLSFFLWGTVPDAELMKAANNGTLKTPAVLSAQVKRMIADPRSEALSTRFASQWLRLQDLEKINPDALLFPYYDFKLSEALRRETELFFDSIVREDHSVLDLLTADYTYVNERVARHYGIPNINGYEFQRVTLADENRRGLLGQGSILALTSVADRTSPVLRGKWIMEVLLGSPPPAPPPGVPLLDETKAESGDRILTTRERMEQHRSNPQCSSCHKVIDPLGLALENFDVTGRWRIRDNGAPVDATGDLYDGTKMSGPAGLRAALLKHQDAFIQHFTERLLTYAVGRRVEYYDMPAIRTIVRDAAKSNNRFSAFVMGVVNSGAFKMSQGEAAETTTTSVASKH